MLEDNKFGDAGKSILIEERITGIEASVFAVSDGNTAIILGTAQDHKRAYDNDQGPNTGGMGAISPAPALNEELNKNIFNNIKLVNWGETPDFDVIINATSLGLNKDDKINLDFTKLGKNKLFYDVIYNPSETNFLNSAKRSGNKYENGKLMFIYQALEAFKLWHKVKPEINEDLKIFLDSWRCLINIRYLMSLGLIKLYQYCSIRTFQK